MTSSRDILAAAKAKFPHRPTVAFGRSNTHSTRLIHAALDELYAALCPPLDADVAAEIKALKAEYTAEGTNALECILLSGVFAEAIDRAFTIGQRQSAQTGSVERVWHPMDTAPKDGTEIQVKIPGHGSDNVVAWRDDLLTTDEKPCGGWQFTRDQEPPDSWTDGTCWEVNENEEMSVKPTAWIAISTPATSDKAARVKNVEFVKQQYGATVATIHETDDSIVEICARNDGVYGLIVHARRNDRDQWDDLTAYLKPEQFEALGTVAKHMRDNALPTAPTEGE